MRHGIYYAYWEDQWQAQYSYYIEKVARLGFDILELAASPFPNYNLDDVRKLRRLAANCKIELTMGHGPSAKQNIGAADPEVRKYALAFYTDLFHKMEMLDCHILGGGIYAYWPVDYTKPVDKQADWRRAVEGIKTLAPIARDCGITLCLEVLNRFEGYLLNTAKEGVQFAEQVGEENVAVMLDTFHMNIEEEDIGNAIRTAGKRLGHFHTGECNRMVPGKGRMPWREIGNALREIDYDKAVVMEPFVRMGGKVGEDIKIWREIVDDVSEARLDADARQALLFQRYMLDGSMEN